MKRNISTTDKTVRVIVALGLALLYYTGSATGTLGVILLIIAAVLLLTNLINFCPLYFLFRINTNSKKVNKEQSN